MKLIMELRTENGEILDTVVYDAELLAVANSGIGLVGPIKRAAQKAINKKKNA